MATLGVLSAEMIAVVSQSGKSLPSSSQMHTLLPMDNAAGVAESDGQDLLQPEVVRDGNFQASQTVIVPEVVASQTVVVPETALVSHTTAAIILVPSLPRVPVVEDGQNFSQTEVMRHGDSQTDMVVASQTVVVPETALVSQTTAVLQTAIISVPSLPPVPVVEDGEAVLVNVGPKLGAVQPQMRMVANTAYLNISAKDVKDGWRPSVIEVGMLLPGKFGSKELMGFVSGYTKQRANLMENRELCHGLWDPKKKRENKFSVYCSRSHRGQRPQLKEKKQERKRSHHCNCQFSVCFSKKVTFASEYRKGKMTSFYKVQRVL